MAGPDFLSQTTITPTIMTTTTASTFDANTRNESFANVIPAASSSTTTAAPHGNTVNIATSITAGRDQYNTYQTTNIFNIPQNTTAGPSSSSVIAPSVSVNDAPLGILSAHFSGCQDELAHMMKAFEAVRGDVPVRFGVYAGPGVGKTQLTLALAKESFAQGRHKCIFWMSATTVEKLHQGFSKLLYLVGHPDRSESEEIVKLTAARRWLEEFTSGRWLLVLDNVAPETVDFLREYLPRINNHGNILFTTRTKKVAMALAHTSDEDHEILELAIPDEEGAARLLLEHFRHGEINGDESKVQKIAKCVGCLPLAIAQAAAYVNETGSTLDALLSIYNSNNKIDMMEWENDLSIYQEKSVAATFTCQLDDLQLHFPNVSNLLKVLAYFDPERIPLDMLITGARILSKSQPQGKGKGRADASSTHAVSAEMSSLLALIQSPMGLPNAIAQLQNRSLTRQQGTGESASLWIHELTQLIVLDNTEKRDATREWFENAVELACSAFGQVQNPESPQSWGQCEVLIPHIQSLTIRDGMSGGANSSLLRANDRIAGYWRSRGRYSDAEVLYKQILSIEEKRRGPEHVDTLTIKHSLALVYYYQGRYRDAEVLYKQVLSNREKMLGLEHVSTLATRHNLALIYDSQGHYSDAEMLFKKVLSSEEKQLGSDHVGTLTTMDSLAGNYYSQRRYGDAEVLYKKVLSSRRNQLGPEHVDTLITKQNLASVYNCQGCFSDAEVLYKSVLSSQENQLGPEHINTLHTKHNLAGIYNSQERYSEAEMLITQVLLSREVQLGPEHVDTLMTKHSLAFVYNSQDRYAEAEALLLHVLAGYEKCLGLSHPYTQLAQHLLADVYTNQGRLDDAEKMVQSVSSSLP